MIEVVEEERLTPAQRLHRRFNEVSARVRGLKNLIVIRQASGEGAMNVRQIPMGAPLRKCDFLD